MALYFPYLAARGDGELAATWHAGVADDLRTHVATIRMTEAGPPRVHVAAAFQSPAFRVPEGGTEPVREPAGEYVPVAFLRDGRIAVVTPIQDVAGERFGFTFRPYRLEANQE